MGSLNWLGRLIHRASLRALRKLESNATCQFLRGLPLFEEMKPEAFLFLFDHLIERRYKRDEMVFKEGNPGICLFIVQHGRVEIFCEDEDEQGNTSKTVLTVMGEGAIFGELSLISMPYRTTSARALDHGTVLLALSTYDLDTLCELHPHDGLRLQKAMNATLATHLVEVDRQLRQARQEIAALNRKKSGNE